MRVIAGSLKGRMFTAPKAANTHPMSDKVRGAVFSALGDLKGLTVLDAYGGSGALAYESISRGAKFVQIIEIAKKAHHTIVNNCHALDLDSTQVKPSRANCVTWVENNKDAKFDLIFADPPYEKFNEQALDALATVLKNGGTFVLSHPKGMVSPQIIGLEMIKRQDHGDAQITFYRK